MEANFLNLLSDLEIIREKKGLNDIQTSFSNIEALNNIVNKMEAIPDYIYNEFNLSKKACIKEIKETDINNNIQVIISESYISFKELQDKENNDEILKQILFDIQKSSFYEEYKNVSKIKEMEIDLIMVEAEEDKDFNKAREKLIEYDKNVFDLELKEIISDFIDKCEENIVIKEKREIQELIFQDNYEKVYEKYDKLFNDYPNQFDDIYKEYLSLLEKMIYKKIRRNEINIIEIEKYKIFINKYKGQISDYGKHFKKIIQFDKRIIQKIEDKNKEIAEKEKEKQMNLNYKKVKRTK